MPKSMEIINCEGKEEENSVRFSERYRKRKTGTYQTSGKRLSQKKGAKARRLEKRLNQYDHEIKGDKLNEFISDELASKETFLENLEVLVISSEFNTAECEEQDATKNVTIKINEEFFEYDAGPEFEINKESIDTTLKVKNLFSEFDANTEFATDDPVCNSLRETQFQKFLDNGKKEDEEEKENALTQSFLRLGSRHVHLGHVNKEIIRLTSKENHHKPTCVNGEWELFDFNDRAETTFVYLQCKKCMECIRYSTHPNHNKYVNPNYAFVLGCLTTGIGHSNAQEMRAAQGTPCMSAKTFRDYQEKIFFDSLKTSRKSMEETAKKEAHIARQRGHVTESGIPYISVMTDASWSKRSYKGTNPNALGCVAVIIGCESKEVIDLIIRTKVCATCDRAEREGREPKEHHCLQDYDRTMNSGGMEKSAIVEGFISSVQKYNIIYNVLIADGDSSVYKGILDANPYKEYNITVKKYGCTCHISKNICKALENFAKKKDPEEVRGDGGLQARQLLDKNIFNIRQEILAAATRRRFEDIPMIEKIKLLVEDINNVLSHILGEHKDCLRLNWPCGGKKEDEENLIGLLKDAKKYVPIMNIVQRACSEAESLIKNGTTNNCECFNNHICKAIGGKRTNCVFHKGYSARCLLQVLQSTEKAVLSTMYKELNKDVPELITTMERNRQLQVERNREYEKRKKNKSDAKEEDRKENKDKDYGPKSMDGDVSKEMYEILCDLHFKKLKENQLNAQNIFNETMLQHNSKLWEYLRSIMITASRMYDICSKRETTSCENTVKSIVHSQNINSVKCVLALQYGLENERNAIKDLEKELSVKVQKSGLIIDPEIEIFGASPDGLIDVQLSDLNVSDNIIQRVDTGMLYNVTPGGILEVKCPISAQHYSIENAIEQLSNLRNVYDKNNSNHMNKRHKYYYQVQGQLHVSRREYCIFAMWSQFGMKKVIVMRDDHFWKNVMEFKLNRFYKDCMLPEIVDSRVKRSMKIREPDYINKAREEKKIASAAKEKGENEEEKSKRKETEFMQNNENDDIDKVIIINSYASERRERSKSKIEDTSIQGKFSPIKETVKQNKDDDDDDIKITSVIKAPYKEEQFNNKLFDTIPIAEFRGTILSTEYLDTICINRFLNVMRRTFKTYELLNVQHLLQPEHIRPFKGELQGEKDVQIFGGNESRHWRCLYFDGSELHILDSMFLSRFEALKDEERVYIMKRYPNALKRYKIRIPNVSKQHDGDSCGAYAAANMVTILLGGKPWNVLHSAEGMEMRRHFLKIIVTECVTEFPLQTQKKKEKYQK